MTKKLLICVLLTVAGLSAYLRANPIHTLHPQPDPEMAQGIVDYSSATSARVLWTEHDNTTGLRVRAIEHQGDHAVIVTPLSPHPDHQDDMLDPVVPTSGVLRYTNLLRVQEFPLSQAGPNWVAVIPRESVSLVPGDRISLLLWRSGADTRKDDEASFWGFLELL